MSSTGQRRSPRVEATLEVTLQTVDGEVSCNTRDASYQGVFIVRPDPLPLRKLIRFRTRLPDGDEQLQMLGLVAHTVSKDDASRQNRQPGMGIQLFSLGEKTRRRWRQFVDSLYQQDPRARETLASSQRPEVRMRIPDEATLQKLRRIHLPNNQLFVRTPELHPPGTSVDCVVVHPDRDDDLTLAATVTEVVDTSVKQRGLHLEIEPLEDPEDAEAFFRKPIPDESAASAPPPAPPDDIPSSAEQENNE